MKKVILRVLVLIGLTISKQSIAQFTHVNSIDKTQIEAVIATYQKALATSDAGLAASLYTKKARFMPSGGPTAVGKEAIKGSYAYVFTLLTPTIEFVIDEVEFIGRHAYVTSTSKGTSFIKTTNQHVPEINRELFLFEKEKGTWKILRYMYNKLPN
jgi:uncharacterized protein (TIGR02246 family)